jgi:hypothetical protein
MYSVVRLRVFSALASYFILFLLLVFPVFGSSQEAAFASISEADQSLAQAYNAVLEAERVGADVSGLLVNLNNAVDFLSKAQKAFELDSFEESVRLANLSIESGHEIVSKAESLKVYINSAKVIRFWWASVGAVLGVSLVISASFIGYWYFKRFYYRRRLKRKSKVGQA